MLSWDERGTLVPVPSKEELERLLDTVDDAAADEPLIATMLDGDEGPALSVGFGASGSVAVWRTAGEMATDISRSTGSGKSKSRGAEKGESAAGGPVEFVFCGEKVSYPVSAVVSLGQAREAMRQFFATGSRPDNIAWEPGPEAG